MENFKKQGIQGDVALTMVDALPKGLTLVESINGEHIVTHSEQGHHHVVDSEFVTMYQDPNNALVAFMEVKAPTALTHTRDNNRHETLGLREGVYRINRQRERSMDGYQRAAD